MDQEALASGHRHQFGSGPDQAHVTFEDVEELGQFVDAAGPQKPAERRVARIVGRVVGLATFGTDVGPVGDPSVGQHRPELVDVEDLTVAPHPLLAVDDAAVAQLDPHEDGDADLTVFNYNPATAYYNCACSLALGGKTDEAFEYLEKALANGAASGYRLSDQLLQTDMDIRSLRSDKRFAELLAKYHGDAKKGKDADR